MVGRHNGPRRSVLVVFNGWNADRATAAMLSLNGPDIVLEVERDPTKVVAEPDRTISAEAMDALGTEMTRWVLSRMIRATEAGRPPKRVAVRVAVKLDGEPAV